MCSHSVLQPLRPTLTEALLSEADLKKNKKHGWVNFVLRPLLELLKLSLCLPQLCWANDLFFSVFHSSACSSQSLPCLHNYPLPTTTFLRSYLFLPHLLYSMQSPNPPLPGRHVQLQEPCKWSPDCQSKGWSLHSDQRHDRYEPVTVTVRPVQSSRIYQQPPRSNLQPCQWGGHRETQGKASVVWVRAGNTVQKRLKRNN